MVTTRSVELDETAPRTAEGPALVAILTVPTPEPTAKLVAPPATVQVPPVSAAPHPLATVRPNESVARAAGAVTVTDFVALSVAPLSSVTVSFTVYVPADPYVWLGLTPPPREGSPKAHASHPPARRHPSPTRTPPRSRPRRRTPTRRTPPPDPSASP